MTHNTINHKKPITDIHIFKKLLMNYPIKKYHRPKKKLTQIHKYPFYQKVNIDQHNLSFFSLFFSKPIFKKSISLLKIKNSTKGIFS
jgi:hypothetical protein